MKAMILKRASPDIERRVAWYNTNFDVEAEHLDAWRTGDARFVVLRISDTAIIDLFHEERDGENVDHIALVTNRRDFDTFVDEHAGLIEMGPATMSGAQGQGQGIYLRDPDGNRIELRTYG